MADINFGLFGAGGFGREVMPYVRYSVCKALGIFECEINLCFVETQRSSISEVNGYPLMSLEDFLALKGEKYYNIAVADGRARRTISSQINPFAKVISIVSPQTVVLDKNIISNGCILCPNSMVTSNATIGEFFHANIYSYVAHDCVIGDYVTFAPGVRCNGRVHIGDFAYLGTNSVIREGTPDRPIRIGAGATVGMGAVVTKDVPDGVTVIGNPARIFVK